MVVFALVTSLGLINSASAEGQKGKGMEPATSALDDGRLLPEYFGEPKVWVETDEIDYLWVADGFEVLGKSLHFQEWPEPDELIKSDGSDRDENDYRLARQMASDMHNSFADVFNRNFPDDLPSSTDEGEILVEGRVIDCSTGNTAAKVLVGFGAGAGNTTIDLRFTDKESGEIVMALHQRVVSGTNWSTTDSKFFKWVKKLGKEISKKGSQELYAGGDYRKE